MSKSIGPGRNVVLITRVPFWTEGFGLATRARALVRFLATRFDLSVVILGNVSNADLVRMRRVGVNFRLFFLGACDTADRAIVEETWRTRFRRHFGVDVPPAAYIVVQTELSFMLEAIPANGRRILDTNDLVSARTRSMAQHGAPDHFPLDEAGEIALFRRYDHVMCIQPDEYTSVRNWIGEKALLVPHPVVATSQPLRDEARSIGIVASRWHANVDGLRWFIEQVWPHFHGRGLTLDVHGFLCEAFADCRVPGLRLHGFAENLAACYAHIDIAINPVRYGAGLKIKSVEALAHGLPLVATPQGASGLEASAGTAFLLARDADEFVAALESLLASVDLRRTLGRGACAYVAEHLSVERCFAPLADCIRD